MEFNLLSLGNKIGDLWLITEDISFYIFDYLYSNGFNRDIM